MRRDLVRLRGILQRTVAIKAVAATQSPGGGPAKDGNEPDRPHQTGRPARGFWGPPSHRSRRVRSIERAATGLIAALLISARCIAQSPAPAPATPLAAAPAAAVPPYKPEYKLSIAVGPAYAWGIGAVHWAQLIKERTAGRIVVKQFPGASAVGGDVAREFVALRDGTIDLAVGSAINWATQVKALNVFALPFLIPDSSALDAIIRGDAGKTLFRTIEEAGVVPLAWGDHELHELSTSQRAVKKPEDVAGLRVRIIGSPLIEETFRALGAMPARLKWSDAQNALLGGTADGQETAAQSFIATKAHTLNQKHLTCWAMAAEPLIFAVSRAAWDGWTPADRDVVRQAAIDAAKRETELSRGATQSAIAALGREYKEAGVEVIRLTPEARAAFARAARSVYDKWASEIGAEMVKQAEAAVSTSQKP